MRRSRVHRGAALLLAIRLLVSGVPLPARAEAQPTAPDSTSAPVAPDSTAAPIESASDSTGASASPLAQARELLADGEYDRAIEVLKPELEKVGGDVERLREAYLLMIKTYVFIGNDLKFKPQGREASNLNYQEARRLIAECLGIRELRHTDPQPANQYPPEMVAFFAETRRAVFGAFRVREVTPALATVLLDGDTLRAQPGETEVGDLDIPIGAHVVAVRAPGYKETTDHITIAPDVTLERTYALTKLKGAGWYATRGVAALALVGGVVAAIANGGGNDNGTEPLPAVPPPPPKP